jgi:aryl-alcohol dehydrogenase-like predicted oxidoreductase
MNVTQITMGKIAIEGIHQPVSQLIMGSMMLDVNRMEHANALLDAYTNIGGNTVDTAHIYGPNGAKALGQWMQERRNRSSMVIIGKGAHPYGDILRMTKQLMEQDLEESLERMQTDYVDIYLLHRDEPNTSVGYIIESLNSLLESKRCLAIGVSNWTTARLEEANDYAASHGLTGFACNSPNLSLAKPNEPRWAGCVSAGASDIAWHTRTQLPLLSWSSQAGGFFTGRFAPDRLEDPEAVRVYYCEANWERLRRARTLAEGKGCDANHIALAYVLRQDFPVCAIIGPNSPQEIASSFEGLQVELTLEEVKWLDLAE